MEIQKIYGKNGHELCTNPMDYVEAAKRSGKSDLEIAKIAEIDPSTLRSWKWISENDPVYPRGCCRMNSITKLKAYMDDHEKGKSFDLLTRTEEILNFDLLIEYGKRLGLISPSGNLEISNEVLKQIFLSRRKL